MLHLATLVFLTIWKRANLSLWHVRNLLATAIRVVLLLYYCVGQYHDLGIMSERNFLNGDTNHVIPNPIPMKGKVKFTFVTVFISPLARNVTFKKFQHADTTVLHWHRDGKQYWMSLLPEVHCWWRIDTQMRWHRRRPVLCRRCKSTLVLGSVWLQPEQRLWKKIQHISYLNVYKNQVWYAFQYFFTYNVIINPRHPKRRRWKPIFRCIKATK